MKESILQTSRECWFCGSQQWLERHHVFGGANRKKSDRLGLTVYLCHYCHNEPPCGVHFNEERNNILKAAAQRMAMKKFGWSEDDFRREFGRSYL